MSKGTIRLKQMTTSAAGPLQKTTSRCRRHCRATSVSLHVSISPCSGLITCNSIVPVNGYSLGSCIQLGHGLSHDNSSTSSAVLPRKRPIIPEGALTAIHCSIEKAQHCCQLQLETSLSTARYGKALGRIICQARPGLAYKLKNFRKSKNSMGSQSRNEAAHLHIEQQTITTQPDPISARRGPRPPAAS